MKPQRVRDLWFVTSQHGRWVAEGSRRFVPAPVAHAKTMGTMLTACGELTGSWQKFWDQTFPTSHAETCSECLAVVQGAALPGLSR